MDLFTLFRDAENPVELMESYAMLPEKSRSGLYGEQAVVPRKVNFGEAQPLHVGQFDLL